MGLLRTLRAKLRLFLETSNQNDSSYFPPKPASLSVQIYIHTNGYFSCGC